MTSSIMASARKIADQDAWDTIPDDWQDEVRGPKNSLIYNTRMAMEHLEMFQQEAHSLFRSRRALARQVLALEALAKTAINVLNQWDESEASYVGGTSDGTTAKELRASLAALTGGA